MYGQKTHLGLVSAGITAASWWMWSVTIALAVIATILLVRVVITARSKSASRRP